MLGLAGGLGMMDLAELQLTGWTQEALATAQIEGEQLQLNSVRASAARRLGLADGSLLRGTRARRPRWTSCRRRSRAGTIPWRSRTCSTGMRRCFRPAAAGWRALPRAAGARTGSRCRSSRRASANRTWCTTRRPHRSMCRRRCAPSWSGSTRTAVCPKSTAWCAPRPPVVRGHPPVRGRQWPHRPGRGGAGAGTGHAQRPAAV